MSDYIYRYALDLVPRILDFFEGYFGIDFPLNKLDMAGIPDFAAGFILCFFLPLCFIMNLNF
jgi:hypothetical protein